MVIGRTGGHLQSLSEMVSISDSD